MQAFTDQPLLRYLGNSLAVAGGATVVSLVVSGLAAYAIARLNLRRRQLILTCIVASSMFPLVTLLVPIFETLRSLGLLNTYTALILPYTVLNLPVCTLVLVSFFQSIPKDLENAAMIDGCTRMGALWRVVLPLAAPGVFTAGILAFVNAWDEFLLALSLNSSPGMRTLPVGITLYQGEFTFPVAGHFGCTHRGHRAGGRADRDLPGARGGRPDAGRPERLNTHEHITSLRHHRLRQHGPRAHREPAGHGRR